MGEAQIAQNLSLGVVGAPHVGQIISVLSPVTTSAPRMMQGLDTYSPRSIASPEACGSKRKAPGGGLSGHYLSTREGCYLSLRSRTRAALPVRSRK